MFHTSVKLAVSPSESENRVSLSDWKKVSWGILGSKDEELTRKWTKLQKEEFRLKLFRRLIYDG